MGFLSTGCWDLGLFRRFVAFADYSPRDSLKSLDRSRRQVPTVGFDTGLGEQLKRSGLDGFTEGLSGVETHAVAGREELLDGELLWRAAQQATVPLLAVAAGPVDFVLTTAVFTKDGLE